MNIGDKVRLKSGGPEMLIISMESGKVSCVWKFLGKVEKYDFDPSNLVLIDDEDDDD